MNHHGLRRAAAGAGGVITYDAFNPSDKSALATLSEADLRVTDAGGSNLFHGARGLQTITEPVYFEFTRASGTTALYAGIGSPADDLEEGGAGLMGEAGGDGGALYSFNGQFYVGGASKGTLPGGAVGIAGVVGIAYRPADFELYIRDSTGYMNGGDPVARTNSIDMSGLSGLAAHFIGHGQSATDSLQYNSGAAGFSFAVPTGYNEGVYT